MATQAGGKNKKYGRNKVDCTRYSTENRHSKNKAKKHAKHNKRMGLPVGYMKNYTAPGGLPHPKSDCKSA